MASGGAKERPEVCHRVQDIDELIEMFKAADDRNYTLFTYVNELNQEVAKLEEQVCSAPSFSNALPYF